MNPEIEKLNQRINELENKLRLIENYATIPYPVEQAFKERLNVRLLEDIPPSLGDAPLATVADPSGGVTVDTQARSTIGIIIDRLQALGLIL